MEENRDFHSNRNRRSRKRRTSNRTLYLWMGVLSAVILCCGCYYFAANGFGSRDGGQESGGQKGGAPEEITAAPRQQGETADNGPGQVTASGETGIDGRGETPASAQDPALPSIGGGEADPGGNPETDPCAAKVEELLKAMTLEEKAAQMFIITPEDLTGFSRVTAAGQATKDALKQYPVGGLIYFDHNLESPEQLKSMTQAVQEYALEARGIPLFLSIDEEGGKVARIGNHPGFSVPRFPDMASIGAKKDTAGAYEVGDQIGTYLQQYGINLDFAPDADVLTNPENQVIGTRSFGTDPQLVSAMAEQMMKGLQNHGVYGVLKHFPGHGATAGDTHKGFAVTEKTLDELMEQELVPFQDGIVRNVPFIMAAHISAPAVTNDNTPATLSRVMITDVLRGRMGYDGIIITDALNMGAVSSLYTADQAALMAVDAGVDILLMPENFKLAYQAVVEAARDGRIPQARIDDSVRRILTVKLQSAKDKDE